MIPNGTKRLPIFDPTALLAKKRNNFRINVKKIRHDD